MKYFLLTLKHKWFVFIACWYTGTTVWRAIFHDWTKFLPSELPHYNRQFFGKANDPEGFVRAWLRHQNRHDHHWEYWIPRTGHSRCNPPIPGNLPLQMSEQAVREMVADWLGASRAYEGKWPDLDNWIWYQSNKDSIRLHPATQRSVDVVISEVKRKYAKRFRSSEREGIRNLGRE